MVLIEIVTCKTRVLVQLLVKWRESQLRERNNSHLDWGKAKELEEQGTVLC